MRKIDQEPTRRSDDEFAYVWAFVGHGSHFPCGVFRTQDGAEAWILQQRLSGVLTRYPLDIGVYAWALETGRFVARKPHHGTAEHIQSFTGAAGHMHYENGSQVG